MSFLRVSTFILAAAGALSGQGHASDVANAQLPAHATLPITFTATVSAAKAKAGDKVTARTAQAIRLLDGREVKAGSLVVGHVVNARAFRYDKTHYAKQSAGTLEIQMDALYEQGEAIPLSVSLRAMADPIATWDAVKAKSTDLDPLGTTTQIGGDLLTPSQEEIVDHNGDVVGYNKKGGAFAHLIGNSRGSLTCDAGDTEQPMSIFSASACGLYGFADVSLTDATVSHIALSSTHTTPEITKYTTALLEVLSDGAAQK